MGGMFHRYVLSNGIEVISEPMENRKTAALGVFVKVGSQDETRENNGISHLLEHMLFQGTDSRTAKEIADITARMGDDVNAFTSKECTAVYGMTITERLEELAMLFGDMLTSPLLAVKELRKEKRIVMDEIDMYQDSAEDLVHELLQRRVWRDDALGFLISGTKSTVRSFDSGQLRRFHREHYYAENMLVSAAGGYEEPRLLEWLERAFAGAARKNSVVRGKAALLRPEEIAALVRAEKAEELALSTYHREYESAGVPARICQKMPLSAGGREYEGTGQQVPGQRADKSAELRGDMPAATQSSELRGDKMAATQFSELRGDKPAVSQSSELRGDKPAAPQYRRSFASADREIEQLHINLAFPALCVGDERRFAYSVLNSAFGGSNNSRLFQEIREEAGMAYSVYSYSSAYQRAGLFHIDITVQPQLGVPVLGKTADIVSKFVRNGLTEEDLLLHKQQVETELIMGAESPKTRMDSNAKFALAGAPLYTLEEKLARIEKISCEDIRLLASDIMKLSECSLCAVGDRNCTDLRGMKRLWKTGFITRKPGAI